MNTDDFQRDLEDLGRELLDKLDCTRIEVTRDGWIGSGTDGSYHITRSGLRRHVQRLADEDAQATFPHVPHDEAALRLLSTNLSAVAATSIGTVHLNENAEVVATPRLDSDDLKQRSVDPHDNYWSENPFRDPE